MAKQDAWLPVPFQQLSQEVDRLFEELIYRPWGVHRTPEPPWTPQLDLYADAAAFVLEADVPGVHEQDVSVTLEAGELVLQGKRVFEQVCDEEHFYCHERRAGEFVRRVRLPASVAQAQIRAEFRDGVLRVTLPKVQQPPAQDQ